jgi:hypothetical protein
MNLREKLLVCLLAAVALSCCRLAHAGIDEQSKDPPAYLKRHIYYMKYQAGDDWVYTAGYYDPDVEDVYYRWKGVKLHADQVPGILRLTNRTPIYDIDKLKGLKLVEIDPPVRYWLLKSGVYAVGYFDPAEWKFFRWGGIALQSKELLPNQPGYPPRLVSIPKFDLDGWPYTKEKEADFLVTIDPPAHLLAQPKLWQISACSPAGCSN